MEEEVRKMTNITLNIEKFIQKIERLNLDYNRQKIMPK